VEFVDAVPAVLKGLVVRNPIMLKVGKPVAWSVGAKGKALVLLLELHHNGKDALVLGTIVEIRSRRAPNVPFAGLLVLDWFHHLSMATVERLLDTIERLLLDTVDTIYLLLGIENGIRGCFERKVEGINAFVTERPSRQIDFGFRSRRAINEDPKIVITRHIRVIIRIGASSRLTCEQSLSSKTKVATGRKLDLSAPTVEFINWRRASEDALQWIDGAVFCFDHRLSSRHHLRFGRSSPNRSAAPFE